MAATKRKFTVPTVEDLDQDEAGQEIKVKPLFSTYTKSSEIVREARYDSSRTIGVNEDLNNAEHYPATKKTVVNETTQSSQGKDKMIVRENCVPNHDSSSREDLQPANSLTAAGSSYGKNKPTVGKTFRETFAYLEDTNHYKETVAKIKEKESTLDVRVPSGSVSTKPKSNAIIVNPRQKGNPVLKHVRNVPWEVGDIIPDYVLGSTTCALFLSLRYHHFNPEYIHERLKQLGQRFELRILLVQVDVKDPHQTLRELVKMAVMADCTLVLAWSAEEAARYLETYKVYENKPPDALLGQSEGDYVSKLTDCLTTIKGVNKTDVVSLSSTFGSLANMATASKEDLALLPGFGPLKAQRLHDLIQQPFVAKRSRDEGEGNKP